jgi:hypothetical protein
MWNNKKRIRILEDRIARAITELQNAPDALIDTRRQINAVREANLVAWSILTEEKHPKSKRN